jgi:hypothetical protein
MGKFDENRARLLIKLALGQSFKSGGLSRASDGKVWTLAIHADPDGTCRSVLNEDDYDTINQLLGGRLSKDEWTLWTKPGPTVWVLSLLTECGEVYAEATELLLLGHFDSGRCLFLHDDGSCGGPARFLCMNRDGSLWPSCNEHADAHRWLRTPLFEHRQAAKRSQPFSGLWQAGPGACSEARSIELEQLQLMSARERRLHEVDGPTKPGAN